MGMYENKKVWVDYYNDYVHVSRIIASWTKYYKACNSNLFFEWMTDLGISKEDQDYISNFARNGKLELQDHALNYVYMKDVHKN